MYALTVHPTFAFLLAAAILTALAGLTRGVRAALYAGLAAVSLAWPLYAGTGILWPSVAGLLALGLRAVVPEERVRAWVAGTLVVLLSGVGWSTLAVHDVQACHDGDAFGDPTWGDPSYTVPAAWTAPVATRRLLDLPLRTGSSPWEAPDSTLVDLGPDALAAWPGDRGPRGPGWSSPVMDPWVGAEQMSLTFAPGGASAVEIYFASGEKFDPLEVKHTKLSIPLDPTRPPDVPITVSTRVAGVFSESFIEGARDIRRLSVILVGAGEAELVRLVVEGPLGPFTQERAAVLPVEIDDVLRPSLYLWGGTEAAYEVTVPEGATELQWQAASRGGTTAVRVGVVEEGAVVASATASGADGWKPSRLPLSRWAGQTVELRIEAVGEGVALLGEPRLVVPSEAPVGVVLYLIDTLRADRVGALGHPSDLTPNLDRLVTEGAAFTRATSVSSWTKPTIPSLLTGMLPGTHRVGATSMTERLPPSVPTLQSAFSQRGWRTLSLTSSPLGSTLSGLEVGFDAAWLPAHWQDDGAPYATGDRIHGTLLDEVSRMGDDSWFAYVHSLDVHEYPRLRDRIGDLDAYDTYVNRWDAELGALVEGLQANWDGELVVVVVSDHGESFGDHRSVGHGVGMWQSQVHVPLVFWASDGLPHVRIDHPVSVVDVAPTLGELFDLDLRAQGTSLVPYLAGERRPLVDHVFAGQDFYIWSVDDLSWRTVISADGRKYLRREDGYDGAFDVFGDNCEVWRSGPDTSDLAARLADFEVERNARAEAFVDQYGAPTSGSTEASDLEALKEIGYLE